jgi:hypothetical protein
MLLASTLNRTLDGPVRSLVSILTLFVKFDKARLLRNSTVEVLLSAMDHSRSLHYF